MKRLEKAVFLDRDGTILKDMDYLSDPDDIHFFKGVLPALKKLKKAGYRLIIGTNQSGIGRGYFTMKDLEKVHKRLFSIFKKNKLVIDEVLFCPHGPDDNCHCRKPRTGMIQKAVKKYSLDVKKSFAVGDKESDILWGKKAGARAILVLTGSGKKVRKESKIRPDHTAKTLPYAAEWILKNGI